MAEGFVLLVFVVALTLIFDYINGFHDTANAIATVVSTNVLPPRTAVMLAAAGRGDEAMALVQRAIAGIEHRVGDEDARLATVLENGARIALAAGHPANAEPLLLRLHALLDAHELSTARADTLLARVAAVRAKQAQEAALTRPVELAAEAPTPLPTPTPTMTPTSLPCARRR